MLLLLAVALLVATLAVAAPGAQARDRGAVLHSAAAYGPQYRYKVGVAVYDTKLNRLYGSGSYRSTFASESVVKAMIATRLLLQGRMHGSTARRAYKMITQSDDAIASSFYGSVGGDGLINWIKRHYRVPDLGSPPHRANWWGNTHITAGGLVKFYAKVKRDRRVGPWLLNAMHHARRYGSDGTYQFFGLPSATTGAAVKQGWGIDYDDWGRSADFNTTGFVNGDRYAVAILARGPSRYYGSAIGNMLTHTARLLLPGGRFPDPAPVIQHMTHRSGPVAGNQRITVRGTDFNHTSAVWFGRTRGTALKLVSSTELQVTAPAHAAGTVSVRVVTDHGTSPSTSGYYDYVAVPTVTSVSPGSGPASGGTPVTLRGADFRNVTWVRVGGTSVRFRVVSPTTITFLTPAGAAGAQPVQVHTWYGVSSGAAFTYLAPPAVTGLTPSSGPAAGGTVVTITGTGLASVTAVRFGATPGTGVTITSPTSLTVVAPAGQGVVDVVVVSPQGTSAVVPADRYTYAG